MTAKTTKTGRPFCVLTDSTGPVIQVNPVLYDTLRSAFERGVACTVELHINGGNVGTAHVRLDAERWSTEVLQSG